MSPQRPKDNKNARLELYQKLEEFDPELARKFRQVVESDGLLQNRYSNICLLEKGGFGLIFKAKDVNLKRVVAIKLLHNVETEKQRRQFNCEATILANLRHPALPVVLDYFCEGDLQFLVMLLIEGEDLGKLLKRKVTFTVQEVLRHADTLLDAVDHLHSQHEPIIHRDVKPANIILTKEKKIILLDFGLAKGEPDSMSLLSEKRKRTLSLLAFTLHYAPLEQLNGAGTDIQSDIFSVGATLYHLATGQMPCKTAAERWREIDKGGRDPLPLAHELNPSIPPRLSQALARAMAINSGERFASAAEMRVELAKVHAEVVGVSQEMEEMVRRFENIRPSKEEAPGSTTGYSSKEALPSTKIMEKDSPQEPLLRDEEYKLRTRAGTRAFEEEALSPVLEFEDERLEEEETLLRAEAEIPRLAPEAPIETPIASSVAQGRRRSERHVSLLGTIAAILAMALASAIVVGLMREIKSSLAPDNTQANANTELSPSVSSKTEINTNNQSSNSAPNPVQAEPAPKPDNIVQETQARVVNPRQTSSRPKKAEPEPTPKKAEPEPKPKLVKLVRKLKGFDKPVTLNHGGRNRNERFKTERAVTKYYEGIDLAKAGKYQKAYESFKGVTKLRPIAFQAHLNAGNSIAALGDCKKAATLYDSANHAYKKVYGAQEDYPEAVFNQGIASLCLNNKDEAMEAHLKLKKLDRKMAAELYAQIHPGNNSFMKENPPNGRVERSRQKGREATASGKDQVAPARARRLPGGGNGPIVQPARRKHH